MLTARSCLGFLPEHARQGVGYGVERGNKRQALSLGAALETGAQLTVDEGEEDYARARLDLRHDPVEMRFRAHHRPEMAHDFDIVELCDRGLGDIFERFAGGIGYEVKVEAVHRLSCRLAIRKGKP